MKVLILGCGYTGTYLARYLTQRKVEVHATNRLGTALKGLNIPVFPFAYSATVTPLPEAALDGITHVLNSIPPDDQGIDPVAASLMPTLNRSPLTWFGYLSTTGVYGDTQGAWVDEKSPVQPQNVRSQHRAAIEATFLQSRLPTHVFRLPGIYGPGSSTLDRLRSGKAKQIDRPGHVFSRIHVDDIVQTVWASMRSPNPGSIYNVADDEPCEPSTLILAGAKLLGISAPPPQPYNAAELSSMAASFWKECRRVNNTKIKQELGVQLIHPTYREGLRSIWELEQRAKLG